MHLRKAWLAFLILTLLVSPLLTFSISANNIIPNWNDEWSFKQEITIPVSTSNLLLRNQPIDILINFQNPCWVKNDLEHSIRVLCWDGINWHELESQIYDINPTESNVIDSCGLVFLIPNFADGNEKYYVYYDDSIKPKTEYLDHIEIKDEYYYLEPISGIAVEGDYFGIYDDDYCIYGIGQKGKLMNRMWSQVVVKLKPGSKKFDMINAENMASFAFGYHDGSEDEDEISSDHTLISKKILIDGNLMGEIGIISETDKGHIKTTNFYKYYYSPTSTKRLCANVKHEVNDDITVKGITNVDGRYGMIFSLFFNSQRANKIKFGEILPYFHTFGEEEITKEYLLNTDPEIDERQWAISTEDDCDIGKEAWFSYDEGKEGKAHGMIFNSNDNLITSGKNERDGIQVKIAEREYLDVIGAEADYLAISYGRNSYESGGNHDLEIPNDLTVQYSAEYYSAYSGGYQAVKKEASIFKQLSRCREDGGDQTFEGDENIYTLTVIPRLSGRILSNPLLANFTGVSLTYVMAELYKDEELVASTKVNTKPLFGAPRIKFPKISKGNYSFKIYRVIGENTRKYIGFESVIVSEDTTRSIYCTWQKNIDCVFVDQFGKGIEDIELKIFKNGFIVDSNYTFEEGKTNLIVPFNIIEPYYLQAFYKGFKIYETEVKRLSKKLNSEVNLYDVTFEVKDKLGLSPGVDLQPKLTSNDMINLILLDSTKLGNGKYIFKNLPEGKYEFIISFGSFIDKKTIKIPFEKGIANVIFSADYDLDLDLYDLRGNLINNDNKKILIFRDNKKVYEAENLDVCFKLPPGSYQLKIYSGEDLIATKSIELTNDKLVNVVTDVQPLLPTIIIGMMLVFIIEILVIFALKKISINTFLKLLAISIVIISLFLPWWSLYGVADNPLVEKNSDMFIVPQTMIESVNYNEESYIELATLPEIFTDFVGILLLIIIVGLVLMGISFIPNIFYKRRFYKILISASIIFIVLVILAFSIGMSQITEISLGSLFGEAQLSINLPNSESTYIDASWGLGLGFFLCIISAIILIVAGFIDYLNRRTWPVTISDKKIKLWLLSK